MFNLKKWISKVTQRLSDETDYVVARGASGNWLYRKWNSGVAECWTVGTWNSYAMTNQSGNGYYATDSVTLPSGLFKDVRVAQANRMGGMGLVFISVYSVSVTTISVYVSCTTSLTTSMNIDYYVMGTWK